MGRESDRIMEGFGGTLPFKFEDAGLLMKVFVHRSFLNEKEAAVEGCVESNERLEFLGDAVLSAVVSGMLYERYPEKEEGELTRLRSRLVNRRTLARAALGAGLDGYLLLGKGERASGGASNHAILASALEALFAAVYMEQGFDEASAYIRGLLAGFMDEALSEPGHFDYKPDLQELAQRIFKTPPEYRLRRESGPQHRKLFEVEAVVNGEVLGTASASTKKEAEQLAARQAIERLKGPSGAPPVKARE